MCPFVSNKARCLRACAVAALCLSGLVFYFLVDDDNGRVLAVDEKEMTAMYFGLHIHRATAGSPWPWFNFGSWRLWDTYVGWPELEPEKGKWDFRRLDAYVEMAERAGVDVLLPLGRTPRWASVRPDESSAYGPGQAAEPFNLADWRNYVRAVALRYKGRIYQYEVWNEPNLPLFFTGNQETLLRLQKDAYQTLKEIDPANILVMPAASTDKQWLDEYLALGGGMYADVIGFHFYAPKQIPEVLVEDIRAVISLMECHGVGSKPLWNTESGWRIANTDGTTENVAGISTKWKLLDPELAAAYVARALILGRAAGLDRFYWYAWDNQGMGLIEPTSKEPKPGARAYEKTMKWLVGKRLLGCGQEASSVWRCQLEGPAGRKEWIIWRTDAVKKRFQPPAQWGVLYYDTLLGEAGHLDNDGLALGELPIRVF
ncbi:MAG: cellulase family glycosylhydrolase [Desulfamplus sp.]|nr:cellulase family glycosylhydrolase [Desulfamplus sp.]